MSLPTCKRRRTAGDNPEKDYISDLPDGLISNILSCLLAKYAVRTSALSRNWRHKWTSIYNVKINDVEESFSGEDGIASFNCAVTRLLLRTQNSRLRSFDILCTREDHRFSDFETWISEVLRRKVQNLEIIAPGTKGLNSSWCFSSWNSLTKLTLEISCTLKVPTDNNFPNLKWLDLAGGRKHGDIKIMTTKFPGSSLTVLSFPVLRRLAMRRCQWLDVTSVEIHAPKLRWFISSCSREFENYEIKICAPKLLLFKLVGNCNIIFPRTRAVKFVNFSCKLDNETSALRAYQILRKFPNLKGLKIYGKALQALLHLNPGLKFPIFKQIEELVVYSCGMQVVLEVLQVLPPLQYLFLDVRTLEDFESGATLTHKILSRLKRVTLTKFSDKKGQYDFVACLLENAKNLEEMTIFLLKKDLNSEVDVESLFKLKPKGSSCELVVK